MKPHPSSLLKTILLMSVACCVSRGASRQLSDADRTCGSAQNRGMPTISSFSQITLKIILVEFSDVKHRTQPRAYTCGDFENMLVSSGTYVSPLAKSPDGEDVFGSVADYFLLMSNGKLSVKGRVLNATTSDNIPIWVTLPHSKLYYQSFAYSRTPMFSDAELAAASVGLDLSRDPVQGTFLVIIYAGNTYFSGGGLTPVVPITCDEYLMSERQGRPYDQENPTDMFSCIGIHCHEIGHCLGLGHSTGSRAELMDAGDRNGPDRRGAAPAPMDPGTRCKLGWIDPIVVSGQQISTLYYSLSSPVVYRINCVGKHGFFLFELRRFDSSMRIGSASCPDYNNRAFFPPAWPHGVLRQGIFAWRYVEDLISSQDDHGLIYASGLLNRTYPEDIPTETDDGVPFPGVANVRVLSPWSDVRDPKGSTAGHNHLFVPSTSSTPNVGMEVLVDNPDSGFAVVKFFAERPIDAPPAKPELLSASLVGSHPQLTWVPNREPDLALKPYKIYVQHTFWSSVVPGAWTLVASTDSTGYNYADCPQCSVVTFRLCAIDTQGQESVPSREFSVVMEGIYLGMHIEPGRQAMQSPGLEQNYPNPFNPSTQIKYTVGGSGGWGLGTRVKLAVYDLLGREVAILVNERKPPGSYDVTFDASGLSSGVYFYRMEAGTYVFTRKLVLLK